MVNIVTTHCQAYSHFFSLCSDFMFSISFNEDNFTFFDGFTLSFYKPFPFPFNNIPPLIPICRSSLKKIPAAKKCAPNWKSATKPSSGAWVSGRGILPLRAPPGAVLPNERQRSAIASGACGFACRRAAAILTIRWMARPGATPNSWARMKATMRMVDRRCRCAISRGNPIHSGCHQWNCRAC